MNSNIVFPFCRLKQWFSEIKYKSADFCLFIKWDILWKLNISNRKKNGIKLVQHIIYQTCHIMNLSVCGEPVKSNTYQRLTPVLLRHNFHGQGIGIHVVCKCQVIFTNKQVCKILVELEIKSKWFKMTENGTSQFDLDLFF